MTAADHADTVRDGLKWHSTTKEKHSARAALDALRAQAERDAQNLRACVAERDEHETRAEAAEAERDRRIDPDVHAAEIGWDGATTALQRCESDRDRLRIDNEALVLERDGADNRADRLADALREYENPDNWDTEDGPPFVWVKDSDPPRIARAALAHTEQA